VGGIRERRIRKRGWTWRGDSFFLLEGEGETRKEGKAVEFWRGGRMQNFFVGFY
jgi:hypothetical protein